jgi:DNA polymerase III delta subunit
MKLPDLQKQIVSKNIDHVLLLFGEEVAIMDIYLDKIYKTTGGDVLRFDSVKEAYAKLVQRRITTGNSRVFVVRDDKDFFKVDKEWAKVFTAAESGADYLILIYSSMDRRSKFFKQNQEKLCEFEKLSSSMLAGYIDKLLPGMSASEKEQFAQVCECNYSRILLEADKVKHYAHALDDKAPDLPLSIDYGMCFQKLLKQGVIYQPIGDITFLFTDAILTRNKNDTAKYLMQAKAIGESEILTLSVLYNGFRNILMVQGLGKDQSEPSKRTGLTPWQVKMAKEKQGHYSIPELVNALKVIRFVEKGIKTGAIDADVAVEYVIVNIM